MEIFCCINFACALQQKMAERERQFGRESSKTVTSQEKEIHWALLRIKQKAALLKLIRLNLKWYDLHFPHRCLKELKWTDRKSGARPLRTLEAHSTLLRRQGKFSLGGHTSLSADVMTHLRCSCKRGIQSGCNRMWPVDFNLGNNKLPTESNWSRMKPGPRQPNERKANVFDRLILKSEELEEERKRFERNSEWDTWCGIQISRMRDTWKTRKMFKLYSFFRKWAKRTVARDI